MKMLFENDEIIATYRQKKNAIKPLHEKEELGEAYYLDDRAEAIVYIVTGNSRSRSQWLYVMPRKDAISLCNSEGTHGTNPMHPWQLAFTTHIPDWRAFKHLFIRDDGRFDTIIKLLGLEIIYVNKK